VEIKLCADLVQRRRERWEGSIEFVAHARTLGTLACEHERCLGLVLGQPLHEPRCAFTA